MLNSRELVHGADFKPLVLRHTEEPCKLKPEVGGIRGQNLTAAGAADGNSAGGGLSDVQQVRPSRAVEAIPGIPLGPSSIRSPGAQMLARGWSGGVTLQPTSSSEVLQFRRLQYRELTPEDYELLCLLDEPLPKKNTAPPNVVSSLPRILAEDCTMTECHVCLTRLEPYLRVVSLPCGHAFHPECISRWLTQCKGTCPLCNTVLDAPAIQKIQGPIVTVAPLEFRAGKDTARLKLDAREVSEVSTPPYKKLAHTSFGRCEPCVKVTRSTGAFIQPGVGDEFPEL